MGNLFNRKNFYKKNILTFITLAFVFVLLALAMPAELMAVGLCVDCEGTCVSGVYYSGCESSGSGTCSACCGGGENCSICSGNYTQKCTTGVGCQNVTNCGVCNGFWRQKCSGNACVNDTTCNECTGNWTLKCSGNVCTTNTNCGGDYCSGTDARDAGCSGNACFDTLKEHCGGDYCSGTDARDAGCSGGACYDTLKGHCGDDYCSGTDARDAGCSGGDCYDTLKENCGVCSGNYTQTCSGGSCANVTNCGVCSGNYTQTCSANACANVTDCITACSGTLRGTGCATNSCVWGEDCATKTSIDSDGGWAYTTAGTVTDYTGCSGGACTSSAYSDYCSATSVYEYVISGASYTGAWYDCQNYEGYYCSGSTYYRQEWGCSGTPGYCNDAAVADTDSGCCQSSKCSAGYYCASATHACTALPACKARVEAGFDYTDQTANEGTSCTGVCTSCITGTCTNRAADDTTEGCATNCQDCVSGTCQNVTQNEDGTCTGVCTSCITGTCTNRAVCDATECSGQSKCNAAGGACADPDVNSTVCTSCYSGSWAIGGEVAPTTCCGDDAGENAQSRLCTSGCTTDFSDKACCDTATDCVYGSTCYSTGWTGSAPWNVGNGTCTSGSWSQNPPVAPSGLTATVDSVASSTKINLAWTDNSNNETGFRLRRAAGSSCNISSSVALTVGSNIISASDINLSQGTKYCYVACSYNADGEACSSSATATTSLPAPSAASFGTIAPTSMVVNWTDNSTGETGFKIERATGSCSTGFSQIGTASANAITYTDTTLSCSGVTYDSYCYRVRAYTADADSSYATIASTKPTLPCAPSSLNASVVSASQVNLSWVDNSGNETGFKIDRKTGSGGTYSLLATKLANVTSHSDSGLPDGTTYYYKVYPYNDDGSSNYSNEVFATTTLPAPSNFLATAISSSQINLTWTDNSSNETGFKIERATTTCSGFLPVHTTVVNVISYSDGGLLQNTTYCYRAYAFNSNISSSYSNESSTTTEVFIPSGYLESSTFDVGSGATFNTILWNGQLNGGHVRFTFASSNCPNGSTGYPTCAGGSLWGNSAGGGAPFLGSDGTETGYYGPADPSKATVLRAADHNQRRYFRYRIYLTAGLSDTPNVSSVIIGYSP